VQAVATSRESVTGLMSPLVTASAMLVTSRPTLTTASSVSVDPQPASSCLSLTTSSCPSLTASTCPPLTTSCVLKAPAASSVSVTCAIDTAQTLSDVVERASSHGEAPQTSTDDPHMIENMALQRVREADLTLNTDVVSCAADTKDSSCVLSEQTADTALMVNAKKTFTSVSERQQTSSQQQEEDSTVDEDVAEGVGDRIEKMSLSRQLEHEPSVADDDSDKAPVSRQLEHEPSAADDNDKAPVSPVSRQLEREPSMADDDSDKAAVSRQLEREPSMADDDNDKAAVSRQLDHEPSTADDDNDKAAVSRQLEHEPSMADDDSDKAAVSRQLEHEPSTADDDSDKAAVSRQLEHEPSTADDDDKAAVSSGPTAAAACSDVSDIVGSKLPVSQDGSCVKSDSAETEPVHKDGVSDGMSEVQEAQESATVLTSSKDDEKNKGDGSEEKMVDEVNEAVVDKNDDDDERSERTGMVSEKRDDGGGTETESSVREHQCRQVMTLPADVLSPVNMSQPISLTLSHHHQQQQQLTVPATNIYQSSSGLRLLLPPDSLPDEYVGNKQLAFTLGRSGDVGQSQMITVSLTVHSH